MANENKYVIALRYPKAYFPCDLTKKLIPIGSRWNDLPEDLVGEIMVRVSSSDRIRFAACCKRFRSLMPNYSSAEIDQFPWVVKLSYKHSSNKYSIRYSFKLFDPIHQTPYAVTWVREDITGQERFSGELLCSKNGWLLLWRRKQIHWPYQVGEEGKLPTLFASFVLVSPFTKKVIALPDLELTCFVGDDHYCSRSIVASFSSNPSSPDCVYFVLHRTNYFHNVRISTFCNGDTGWKTGQFFMFLHSFNGVVYHEGSFYCVSMHGRIAAYIYIQNIWRLVTCPVLAKHSRDFSRLSYLLVCEGKLLLVFKDVPYNEKAGQEDRCIIFEHVQYGDWVEKMSLGNNALFLSRFGSFSISTLSHMASRIYYNRPPGDGRKKYYSLEDVKPMSVNLAVGLGLKVDRGLNILDYIPI